MAYFSIDNFKFGLDSRRTELTSNPGSLSMAVNGHVNEGGQFDKRTKFGLFKDPITGTFGFQEVGDALLVFGSAANPLAGSLLTYPYLDSQIIASTLVTAINLAAITGVNAGAATNGSFTLTGPASFTAVDSTTYVSGFAGTLTVTPVNSTTKTITVTNGFPSPYTVAITIQGTLVTNSSSYTTPFVAYQRLQSPFGANMTAVISSCAFNNKSFVIAKFDDGTTLMFYDGSVIVDSYEGWVEALAVSGAVSADTLLGHMKDALLRITGNAFVSISGHNTLNMTCTAGMSIVGTWFSQSGGTLTAAITAGTTLTVTVSGTWSRGDHWTFSQTLSPTTYIVGYQAITQQPVTFCYTFNNRVYVLGGTYTYLSGVGAPTSFNDPNVAGTGFINMSNRFGITEPLISCCHYQGHLAFFSRRTIQIWQTDADPTKFVQLQILQNIGTFAALGPQPVGDFDIVFPSDSGVRSIQVRDSSLNARVSDVGSPLNPTLSPIFANATAAELAAMCAIVEPTYNRYWLYVNTASGLVSTIYVLSHFQVGKITAWSQYTPTYVFSGATKTFTVQKFVLYQGQIYLRVNNGTNDLLLYFDRVVFDNCTAQIETPWHDIKRPGTEKVGRSVDVAITGQWKIEVGMDPKGGTMDTTSQTGTMASPDETKDSTFDGFSFPFQGQGTHVKLRATSVEGAAGTAATAQPTVSAFTLHYNEGNQKP